MLIRRATPGDLEDLLPLVSGYREFYRQPVDHARERAFMERHLRSNSSVVFIAVEEGVAIGFTQLFTTYSTVHLGPALILEDLFVASNARRNGVATALLDAALTYAREIEATGMFLETAMENRVAQELYERAGWQREGRFFKYNAEF